LDELSFDIGKLTADAGLWLRDAGSLLLEAGAGTQRFAQRADGSAQAQSADNEHYFVGCDELYERTQSSGYASDVTTHYSARARVDHTDDIVAVDVRLCNRELFGSEQPACSDGFACTGSDGPEPTDCIVQPGAELGPNFVRASCGTRALSAYADTHSERGSRWQDVHFVVRRR
jgi:hypothetical protein